MPCFIHINFRDLVPDRYMPSEELVDAGYAVLSFCYKDVSSDDGDFTNGLAGHIYPGGKRDSGVEDASIVATHMILAAADEGVNSCWLNYFDPDQVAEQLGLPENEEVLMLMDLGYAAEGAGPLPNHGSRKELAETVTYL